MRQVIRMASLALPLALVGGTADTAQAATQSAITLQASGSFARGGVFTGSLTINRFEERDDKVWAIGVVQGTLRRGNNVLGTGLAGEVEWPVRVRAGGVVFASRTAPAAPALVRASARLIPVQNPPPVACTPLHISLGATNVDLLGLDVALEPIGLTLTGEEGTPLGDLVCSAVGLLSTAADVVELLTSVLGLLTGLLGGLTGGIAPPA